MFRFTILPAVLGLSLVAGVAKAHEFWISPEGYRAVAGERVAADLRVGQDFSGSVYSYNPARFVQFLAGFPDALTPVEGRVGDRPAFNMEVPDGDGLFMVVHETSDSTLTYTKWEKFTAFAQKHDLGEVASRQKARGLPQEGFSESYRRFAKSLIAVGSGAGADRLVGLDVEILVQDNPYQIAPGTPLAVQMFQNGAPRQNAQLEVFTRTSDGAVDLAIYRSDESGTVAVPSVPGSEVLLSFVVLEPRDGDPALRQPVWHSLWASTTYSVPN